MRCAHGEKRWAGARVYCGCSSASTEERSYKATYLGHPFTATYRDERSNPGTVDKRGKCSVSYHSLNSSSRSGGGVIIARSSAFFMGILKDVVFRSSPELVLSIMSALQDVRTQYRVPASIRRQDKNPGMVKPDRCRRHIARV